MYNKRILGIKDPYAKALFKYWWRDVHKNNFGYYGVNTGGSGEGKSLTSLLQAWIEDDTFTVDNLKEKYLWSPREFHKFINTADKYEWGIWDETGITLSSKKWHTMSNIMTEDIIQTMRIKKLGVIFISQMVGFVDNRARALFRWFTETKRWESNSPFWKIHRVDANQLKGTSYYPHPVFRINGNMVKLRGLWLNAIIKDKIKDQFDIIHETWKKDLMKRHHKTITKIEMDEERMDIWELAEEVKKDPKNFMNKNKKLDYHLIMAYLEIGEPKAKQIMKIIEQKR